MTQTQHNSTLASSRLFSQLISILTAIKWTRAGHDDEAAFQRVEVFFEKNAVLAAEELLNFKDRYCYIIPPVDEYKNIPKGGQVQTTLTQYITLLLSDRKYGFGHSKALLGSDDNPGVYTLRDLTLSAIACELITPEDKPVCYIIEPTGGELIALSQGEKDALTGRLIYELRLQIVGQYINTTTGNKPIPYHP